MNESKITLFLSRNKALALLSILPSAMEDIRQEVVDHKFDPNVVEFYSYLDSVYDDLVYLLLENRQ